MNFRYFTFYSLPTKDLYQERYLIYTIFNVFTLNIFEKLVLENV